VTNGQRWIRGLYLRSISSVCGLGVRVYGKSGRGINGCILTRHRQVSSSHFSIRSLGYGRQYGYGVVQSFFFHYKQRIILMLLTDRHSNWWCMRYVTGLRCGDIVSGGFAGVLLANFSSGGVVVAGLLQPLQIFCQLQVFKSGCAVTSNGTYGGVISIDWECGVMTVYLASKRKCVINLHTMCVVGRVGGEQFSLSVLGRAGSRTFRGSRPSVRGVAMNPVDHPHGGRTKTNSPELSPWGWVTKHSK